MVSTIFEHSVNNPLENMYRQSLLLKNIVMYSYLLGLYLLLTVPKYMYIYLVTNFEELVCYVNGIYCYEYILFILLHSLLRYEYIVDIVATDYFEGEYRYQLNYQLTSVYVDTRIRLKVWLQEIKKISSISGIYEGAGWYEREILDFFGIGFTNNTDLRRLLTDYAFEGYPLKKDFPLSGFVEIHYNDFIKRLGYVAIKLVQEFRLFELLTPWGHFFQFKYSDLFYLYKSKKNTPLHLEYLYTEPMSSKNA